MKKVLKKVKAPILTVVLLLLTTGLFAQNTGLMVDSGQLVIKNGYLFVPGALNIAKYGEVHNEDTIYLGDSIVNRGSSLFKSSSILFLSSSSTTADGTIGDVIFTGKAIQHVKSRNDSVLFSTITVNNPNEVHLDTSIYAFGAIILANGNINLKGHDINTFIEGSLALNSGHIVGENNNNRIYDNTAIDDNLVGKRSGYVKAYSLGGSSDYKPDFLGINLSGYNKLYVDRGHISLPYSGDGSIRKYFKLSSISNSINPSITISYLDSADYKGLNIKEPDFRLFAKGNPTHQSGNTSTVEYTNLGGTVYQSGDSVKGNISSSVSLNNAVYTVADQDCKNAPVIKFASHNVNVCQDKPFTLEDTAHYNPMSGTTIYYKWYVNNLHKPDTLHSYIDTISTLISKTYKVKKYDNRGCFSFDSVTVTTHPIPQAAFKHLLSFYCDGTSLAFTDSSSISDLSALTRTWAFGDGQTSTIASITHTYPSALTYNGYLAVKSNFGCADTATFKIDIKPIPKVDFTVQQECSSTKVLFKNQSSTKETYFKKAVWDFTLTDSTVLDANEGKIPLKDTSFIFPATGSKTVRLTMTGTGGCKAFKESNIVVNPPSKASFTAGNVCFGSKTNLQNTSVVSGSPAYLWDFGDGTTSTASAPDKVYGSSGSFNIKLKLTSGTCKDSVTHSVYVNTIPNALFTLTNACLGKQITFTPTVTGQGQYSWNIDGDSYTTPQVVKTFNKSGTFVASLIVKSDSGCIAQYSRNFDVYQIPKADFTSANVCFGNPMAFYNQSVVQGGSLTYNWDFGDYSSSVSTNPTHTYGDSARTWPVKLVAESNFGCRDSVTKTVEVYPLPNNNLPAARSTCGSSMTLDATSSDPHYTVISYLWSNGNKTPITVANANNTYSVTLKTDKGCATTKNIKVTLNSQVNPMLPDVITFCGKGNLDASYPDINCLWSTGEQKQIITVTQTGWYKVDVKDENNCTARDSSYVTVNPTPVVELGNDVIACSGSKVNLDAGSGFSSYQWSTQQTISKIDAKASGHFTVTVTDANGCSANDAINVSFIASPQRVLPKTIAQCKEVLLDAANPGSVYDWSNFSNTQTILVNQTGVYSVKITNANNCSVYDTATVTILPVATINLGSDISICDGQFVTLNAGNNGSSYTYKWNGQSSASSIYRADKSGRYIVQAINSGNGCTSSDTVTVYYKPSPIVNLGNDRMLCNSASVNLDAGNPGALVQWGSTTGLINTQQTIEINGAGKYWATVMNPNGCIGSDTITIYPSAGEMVAEFIAASTVKAGDTVHFVNVSYPEPYTCSWYFGDGVTSTENSPTHVFFMNDTFKVNLTISNSYCSATVRKPIAVQGFKKGFINPANNGQDQFVEILSSKLYPNPATDNITLEMTLSKPVDMMISIYDLKGSLLLLEKIKNSDEILKEYSLKQVSSGIYILKANAGKVSRSFKIMKR